jgi:ribonuclease R
MLPEKLSNGICSLNPHLDRLAITCQMEVDSNGKVVKTQVYPTIINSNERMIYHDVNKFLKNKTEITDPKLSSLLTTGHELSRILSVKNQSKGYIDFEIEEAKVVLNKKGRAEKIEIRKQDVSEKMIENFMVLANEQVALFIETKGLPFIYRTHGKPKNDKIQNLKNVMKSLGIDADVKSQPSSKEFAAFVKKIKDTRFDNFIKIMLLRTMAKAVYAKNNIGHFGLALSSYTHFTSPIRRYPDLMVHRMLRTYIFENNLEAKKEFEHTLQKIATANSASEVIATDLERQIVDFKKAELYEKYIGSIREGLIVSINRFGMFVEFEDKVDGLVRLDSMQGF